MTRKDFELMAEAIRGGRSSFKSNAAHAQFACRVALQLADTYPLFDYGGFVMACMPRAWVGTAKANVWERSAR